MYWTIFIITHPVSHLGSQVKQILPLLSWQPEYPGAELVSGVKGVGGGLYPSRQAPRIVSKANTFTFVVTARVPKSRSKGGGLWLLYPSRQAPRLACIYFHFPFVTFREHPGANRGKGRSAVRNAKPPTSHLRFKSNNFWRVEGGMHQFRSPIAWERT